jgi:hypothetical protein
MPIVSDATIFATGAHDQADRRATDSALRLGASGRGMVSAVDNRKSKDAQIVAVLCQAGWLTDRVTAPREIFRGDSLRRCRP